MTKDLRTPEIGETVEILIESIAAGGRGKGSAAAPGYEKLAFFVDGTAPGDRVRARVTGGRKRYFEADLSELLAAGPSRAEPPCPHYPICGGCQIMHLAYDAQLAAKQDILTYLLRRRGLGELPQPAMTASPRPLRYRVRSTLALTRAGEPAMQRRSSHELTPLTICPQMREPLEAALFPAARALAAKSRGGPLRVRGVLDPETGRVFAHPFVDLRDADSPANWFEATGGGVREIAEPLCLQRAGGHVLRYPPDCFTQANPEVNDLLVAQAIAALAPAPADRVLELYAGVGNFTLPLAAIAKEVVAVERARAAEFGRRNAKAAGRRNVKFIGAEVSSTLAKLAREGERFDLLLADPPRAGLGPVVCRALGELRPRRLAYVSCDPQTLVDDLTALAQHGYKLHSVASFDMFPQTFHFETCVILSLD